MTKQDPKGFPLTTYRPDIVVIGASAGGVSALSAIVKALPRDFPAAIFVVLHLQSESKSMLAPLLARLSAIDIQTAKDGQPFQHGHVYVAPPDYHLALETELVRVTHGPLQNRHRPSIDVLFRSAAVTFGPRVIGVVLTGFLSDGTAGLSAIKAAGGITVVQDPTTAMYPSMPESALRGVTVDHVVALEEIPSLLLHLCSNPSTAQAAHPDQLSVHRFEADADRGHVHELDKFTTPSSFLCPDCGGALWELKTGTPRFRCRVGHGYSLEDLMTSQDSQVESALWAATRSLEDRAVLSRRLAEQWRERGASDVVEYFARKSEESEQHAATLRKLLGVEDNSKST